MEDVAINANQAIVGGTGSLLLLILSYFLRQGHKSCTVQIIKCMGGMFRVRLRLGLSGFVWHRWVYDQSELVSFARHAMIFPNVEQAESVARAVLGAYGVPASANINIVYTY